MVNKGIIKETNQGFSLWFHNETPKLWDVMYGELQKVGGYLTSVKIKRLLLTEKNVPDLNFASYRKYSCPETVEGIIILKGAARLEQALRKGLPNEYSFYGINTSGGYIVTPELVKRGDRFTLKDRIVEADYVQEFFDVETLSFSLVVLKRPDN